MRLFLWPSYFRSPFLLRQARREGRAVFHRAEAPSPDEERPERAGATRPPAGPRAPLPPDTWPRRAPSAHPPIGRLPAGRHQSPPARRGTPPRGRGLPARRPGARKWRGMAARGGWRRPYLPLLHAQPVDRVVHRQPRAAPPQQPQRLPVPPPRPAQPRADRRRHGCPPGRHRRAGAARPRGRAPPRRPPLRWGPARGGSASSDTRVRVPPVHLTGHPNPATVARPGVREAPRASEACGERGQRGSQDPPPRSPSAHPGPTPPQSSDPLLVSDHQMQEPSLQCRNHHIWE